jgi:hypothetical protein
LHDGELGNVLLPSPPDYRQSDDRLESMREAFLSNARLLSEGTGRFLKQSCIGNSVRSWLRAYRPTVQEFSGGFAIQASVELCAAELRITPATQQKACSGLR